MMKPYTKFERNRAIRGGVITITMFDLMTLNMLSIAVGEV